MSTGLDRAQLVNRLVLSAEVILLDHRDDGAGQCSACKVPLAACSARAEALSVRDRYLPPAAAGESSNESRA